MTMLLICSIALWSEATTFLSLSESRAAVGSSSSNTSGDLINALAIATRCLCPPDSDLPPSPILVSSSRPRSLPGSTDSPAFFKLLETAFR
mmetsp:Transcript_40109/g.111422  ORF Transcript_40109/g.111422 Transcript_40109/m.111422 type:complete len:91 (+) Transcript_40109:250-522(+)